MKYVCLIYYPEAAVDGMSDAEWAALVDRCQRFGEELRGSGHMLGGEPLRPVAETCTVQVRDGEVSVTDGPFAETREQLAGFYLIEAADMREATAIAARIPPASLGRIEVRPVRQLPER